MHLQICYRENVGLLAYSPMGFGVLSGKFLTGESHPKARLSLFPQYSRYSSEQSQAATKL
jgi:aryl-alcohol dehydrogenase-like predicted oxidoreductase